MSVFFQTTSYEEAELGEHVPRQPGMETLCVEAVLLREGAVNGAVSTAELGSICAEGGRCLAPPFPARLDIGFDVRPRYLGLEHVGGAA